MKKITKKAHLLDNNKNKNRKSNVKLFKIRND